MASLRATPALHRLRWSTPDPAALADRLRREGIEPWGDVFALGPLVIRLVAGATDRLVVDDDPGRGESVGVSPGWATLAVAWATVDLDRAAARLGAAPADRRPRDATLGASAVLVPGWPVAVALLEPDTEGRLAAMLARHGEGPVGAYAVRASPPETTFGDRGPFGPQRLFAASGPPWSPVLLRVQPPRTGAVPAATIRP